MSMIEREKHFPHVIEKKNFKVYFYNIVCHFCQDMQKVLVKINIYLQNKYNIFL